MMVSDLRSPGFKLSLTDAAPWRPVSATDRLLPTSPASKKRFCLNILSETNLGLGLRVVLVGHSF